MGSYQTDEGCQSHANPHNHFALCCFYRAHFRKVRSIYKRQLHRCHIHQTSQSRSPPGSTLTRTNDNIIPHRNAISSRQDGLALNTGT
ncbi:uncharacterized [Tachysurus ichikawai]